MQAVRSVASGGKFYRLPPDKESTAKATLTLTSHLGQNVDLAGERVGSRWSVSQKRIMSDPLQAEH